MKTINEIMKVTECTLEQAEKLYNKLIKLPEELGNFMSDHLDLVNAYNADEIQVIRHYGYSRYGADIIVRREEKVDPHYCECRYYSFNYEPDCIKTGVMTSLDAFFR